MFSIRSVILVALLSLGIAAPGWSQVSFWVHEWPDTDFESHSVPFEEIFSGGVSKDGIPALSDPDFIPVSEDRDIQGREPVMTVEIDGEVPRAYPIRYLTWHEIVNDQIGAVPVAVTFCPLCNSGIVFDRRLAGQVLTFGVSGKLRNSDMVMYDRETNSWWQQILGEGIVGVQTGAKLTKIAGWMESWDEFKDRNPDGLVMAEPSSRRPYGRNPYTNYDSSFKPFLYDGELPPHDIPALARVLKIGNSAWPLERLRTEEKVVEGGYIITWREGQASALDHRRIAKGKEVGTIRVKDAASGNDVVYDLVFAFAFHAFFPDGNWMLGGS